MIAIIVLFALAVVTGLIYTLAAILIAIVKVTARRPRRAKNISPDTPVPADIGVSVDQSSDGEFMRIVSSEWPTSFQDNEEY